MEVSWDELIELLASELRRTVDRYGNEAIYGSSYGWASAGRFHHAQSQVHRFLNMVGGYTASRHSYSAGASEVIFRISSARPCSKPWPRPRPGMSSSTTPRCWWRSADCR